MITEFNQEFTEASFDYSNRPVICILRVWLKTTSKDWPGKLSAAFFKIRVCRFDENTVTPAMTEEHVSFSKFVTPFIREPAFAVNSYFTFSSDLKLSKRNRVGHWSAQVELRNYNFTRGEKLFLESIDSNDVREALSGWSARVQALIQLIGQWVTEIESLSMRISEEPHGVEEMMQRFNVGPGFIQRADIARGKKMIIAVKPFARWILGGRGRIDLLTAKRNFVLVDKSEGSTDAEWMIYIKNSQTDAVRFTKTVFHKI